MSAAVQEGEYERDLAQYARVDWLYFGRCDRLHAPAEATYDATDWCLTDVTLACGQVCPPRRSRPTSSRAWASPGARTAATASVRGCVGTRRRDHRARLDTGHAAREVLP